MPEDIVITTVTSATPADEENTAPGYQTPLSDDAHLLTGGTIVPADDMPVRHYLVDYSAQ